VAGAGPAASQVVREFWRLMATNDFEAVRAVLAPGFACEWPQSRERIRGGERFARMNREYPAHGPWRFDVQRFVADDAAGRVVTDVTITDGVQRARALSFFEVEGGLVTRLVEYWPEDYAAPANRAHLVEAMD
jgi:limonene-1,2-epoxide hydrolase